MLPVADHAVPHEHLHDPLGEEACEQLHIQLAQGYGLVVVQLGGARDLWAEPNGCISPVGRCRGATKDVLIGVDKVLIGP